MSKKPNIVGRIIIATLIAAAMITIFVVASWGHPIPVLQTHGVVADRERDLIYITVGLGLVVVIPVFIMLFTIAWKYRATNTKARYEPTYDTDKRFETLWWGIPCAIILILAIITTVATHALDPYRPLDSSIKPVNIQVVALEWRWLFIYPDQHVASMHDMVIPANTPINLTITSDAPMNSFWVPALAGQIYAMSGMSTQLHLMADTPGTYMGSSANISGTGFADMTFAVKAVSSSDFTTWTHQAAQSHDMLDAHAYRSLAQPSTDETPRTFMLMDDNLYNGVIMKTMGSGQPQGKSSGSDSMQGMSM